MNLIAAVDRTGPLKQWTALVRIPNDHKMFRQETLTRSLSTEEKRSRHFLSQPLDRRVNIILSTNKASGALPWSSTVSRSFWKHVGHMSPTIFMSSAPASTGSCAYCDTAHITKIDYAYQADAWFLNLTKIRLEDPADSEEQTYFDMNISS